MGDLVEMAGYQERKAVELSTYPALECPRCEALCSPVKIDSEGSVHHRCQGNGHRAITWRIAVNGDMLSGSKGSREYKFG